MDNSKLFVSKNVCIYEGNNECIYEGNNECSWWKLFASWIGTRSYDTCK